MAVRENGLFSRPFIPEAETTVRCRRGGCSFPAFPNGGLARSTSYSRAIFTAHETVYQLPYEGGELQEYLIMRLTGQSCKINLLREALKYLFREK